MDEDYIWIVTDTLPMGGRDSDSPRNPYTDPPHASTTQRSGIPVSATKLEEGIADFLKTIGRVIKNAQQRAQELGGMELDEIELSVEVNGEGQLSLLGTGTKVGGSGAITLHFRKVSVG